MQPESKTRDTSGTTAVETTQADASTATRKPFDLLSLNNLPAFGNTR